MVRLREPFFLEQITIRWHQVTGSPNGTCSSTPSQTSLSRPAFTSYCQCRGTGMGEWWAVGVACLSIMSLRGGPRIRGRVWCSHVLKVLDW